MRPAGHSTELVVDAMGGDTQALDRLVDVWLPVLLRWCAHLGGGRVDPEDAAHDVCVLLLTKLGSLRHPDMLPSWLFGACRRVLANKRRRAWFKNRVGSVLPELVDPGPSPLELASGSQAALRVHDALNQLPVSQREVVVLCDRQGLSASEAAALLAIPIGTVKSRLRSGRAQFRRAWRRESGPGSRPLESSEVVDEVY